MKKFTFSFILLLISVFFVQAQTEKQLDTGNVSIYLCDDYNGKDIMNLFTGFNSKGKGKFKIVVRMQDFKPNVVHKLIVKIIDPNQKSMFKDEEIPFILESKMHFFTHTDNVSTTFHTEGAYQVQAWVDGKLVQYINFNVGGTIAKNIGKGNIAMLVCDSYNNDNISGIYSGLKRPITAEVFLSVRFQDFLINQINKFSIKLISPTGENMLSKKEHTFTQGHNTHTNFHNTYITAKFPQSGIYQFQVEANGKIIQYLNFNIGEN